MFNLPFQLPPNWEITTVGDLVKRGIIEKPLDGNHGGTHPKSSDYLNTGIPFVMASDLDAGRVTFDTCKFISFEQARSLRKGFSKEGDVLISHKATIGRTALVQKNEFEYIMLTPQVTYYRVKDYNKLNNIYLKAYFDSSYFQTILSLWAGAGSTRAYLGITDQLKLPVILPTLDAQLYIADISLKLNNKIHLNTQTNQTLESIAQAIFKSWFVDFEPVKAKMAAKERWYAMQPTSESASPVCYADDAALPDLETYTNLAAMCAISGKNETELAQLQQQNPDHYQQLAETAALFPSAMVDSELGEIPEGWEVKPLDVIAQYQNGLALQNFRPDGDEYLPVLKIAQLKKGFADGEEKASPNIKSECIVEDGDVVFSWSGSLMVDVWCGGKAALNQHLFKVTSTQYPRWVYYYCTKHHLADFQRIASDKAVTMGHIKREHLSNAKCALPASDVISLFTQHIESLIEKQVKFRLEVFKLSELRDSLLPKLLSGEIDLTKIENEVI